MVNLLTLYHLIEFENPVNKNGHKTSYLWEDILTKVSILDLINNFIHLNTEEKNLVF